MNAILDALLGACRAHSGDAPSETLRRSTGDFLARAREDISLLRRAADSLSALPPAGAAWLAVAVGAVIEDGEGVDQTTPGVVDLFLSWLPRLPAPEAADSVAHPEPTPEQSALLQVFPQLCQSVVAHVARMPERRAALAGDAALLDRLAALEAYSHGASWVREMLLRCSGALMVLHPPSGQGLRVRYENVATCFHLFSLLQTAIGRRIPGGQDPDTTIAAAARGRVHAAVTDTAWWHYGNPGAKTAELGASIWGEASVRSIAMLNGVQVVLLWPPILASRSWDSSFFGPHLDALPADVIVESDLSAEERRAWFQAVGIPREERRKWWRPR